MPNSWHQNRLRSGEPEALKGPRWIVRVSCACHDDHSTGSSTSMGVHTFDNEQLGLDERDEGTHYPVFVHLWATNLPGGTRAALRSDAAQTRRLSKAATKNDRKRQRRLNHAAASKVDPAASTATAEKSQSASSTRPSIPKVPFSEVLPKVSQVHVERVRGWTGSARGRIPRAGKRRWFSESCSSRSPVPPSSFMDEMCEILAESSTNTDEEVSYQNIFNALLNSVPNNPTDGMYELLVTDAELA